MHIYIDFVYYVSWQPTRWAVCLNKVVIYILEVPVLYVASKNFLTSQFHNASTR